MAPCGRGRARSRHHRDRRPRRDHRGNRRQHPRHRRTSSRSTSFSSRRTAGVRRRTRLDGCEEETPPAASVDRSQGAGSRWARSCSSGSSTTGRCTTTSTPARSEQPSAQRCRSCRASEPRSRSGCGTRRRIAALAAEARTLGYVRPGEHLFIVKDIPQWRAQRASCSPPWITDADRALVARQLGREPRTLRACRGALPVRGSGRHRAEPVRRGRRAVPDDVLPHVPPSRRRDRRGSKRPAASSAGARRRAPSPRSPRASRAATRAARGSGASSPVARPAATAAPRSTSASAARAAAGSLKCLHAHVAFALASPGYELGERILAEVDPLWPDRCCSHEHGTPRVRSRSRGSSGRRAPAGSRPRARTARATSSCSSSSSSCSTSSASRSGRRTPSPSSPSPTATPSAGRREVLEERAPSPGLAARSQRSSSPPHSTPTSAAPSITNHEDRAPRRTSRCNKCEFWSNSTSCLQGGHCAQ